MIFSDKELSILLDLVGIAWQAGAIRGPQQAMEIEQLRVRLARELQDRSKPDAKAENK